MQHIIVVDYDPAWEKMFCREAQLLRQALGENLIEIHHIGSTAVPGLAAKPIIDIMPVVQSLEQLDLCNPSMEALGYECMGEFGIPGRRYFRKGGAERTHQIHAFCRESSHEIRRHLAVRDYLRNHPEEAARYGGLKQRLALEYPYDIDGYCDGKDAYVKRLEHNALSWLNQSDEKKNEFLLDK